MFNAGMLQQLQQMQSQLQEDMAKVQSELETLEITGQAQSGAVKVVANGKYRVSSVYIDSELVDPEDKETLEDLLLVAMNDAMSQVQERSQQMLSEVTKGMPMPPGMNMFGS